MCTQSSVGLVPRHPRLPAQKRMVSDVDKIRQELQLVPQVRVLCRTKYVAFTVPPLVPALLPSIVVPTDNMFYSWS